MTASLTGGAAAVARLCQDGPVVKVRTVAAVTLMTLAVSGCGGGPGTPSAEPSWMATPQITATTPASLGPSATVAPAAPTSAPAPSVSAGAATPSATATAATTGGAYVFPVAASNVSWHRTHGKYPATDIFASCGRPVLAVTAGTILEVSRTDNYVKGRPDGPLNGGLSVSLLGDDGVRYYGSHLSKVQGGISAGVRVRAGRQLGLVGRSGNANGVCHLHFGISPKCAGTGDWKVRRGVVWPWSYFDSWHRKGNKSPVAAVNAWAKAHNCKA
jgi:murein DD-endopeptidase MepM/ murein hydrolase activator NlpD